MTLVHYKYSSVCGDFLVPCEVLSRNQDTYVVKYVDPFNNFIDIVYTDKEHLEFPKFSEYGGL